METFDRLRSQVLSLADCERAEPAHDLITSLDAADSTGVAAADIKNAWKSEIQRRIAQIDAGQATLLNRDEFRARVGFGTDC